MNFTLRDRRSLERVVPLFGWIALLACTGAPPRRVDEAPAAPVEQTAEPAPIALVPAPSSVIRTAGTFTLTPETQVYADTHMEAAGPALYLTKLLFPDLFANGLYGLPLSDTSVAGAISLLIDASLDSLGTEGYALRISSDRITASAPSAAGLFYAVQTLRQLLPAQLEAGRLPRRQAIHAVSIVERPRFAWRGAMLDVSRHFLEPAAVKRYIDLMALYKLNRLHLHLSDDQGWRIEIKSWPNLTTHGGSTAVGGGPGGFYTQAEYADLVEYARRRFITVVPEIDMPGHINAALASYPELNCDGRARELYTGTRVGFSSLCVSKDITYRFVDDVIREISALTPGPWFHVGGDEVKTLSPGQYAAFIERVQSIVRSHGKEMIGWDEIGAAKLLPTTIVQYWRPNATAREAISQGTQFILSPANKVYLDMKYDPTTVLGLKWAGYVDVRTSFDWDPATHIAGVGESSVVGIEAPLWSETLVTIADFEYMAFPRLAAVAEVAWSPAPRRAWEDFRQRLARHAPRWSALGLNYYRSPQIPWR